MRVKMIVGLSGPNLTLDPDDEHDFAEYEAKRLVEAGFAEFVETDEERLARLTAEVEAKAKAEAEAAAAAEAEAKAKAEAEAATAAEAEAKAKEEAEAAAAAEAEAKAKEEAEAAAAAEAEAKAKAEAGAAAAANPLDHDGDGKAGGSLKGAKSTRAKGAAKKEN